MLSDIEIDAQWLERRAAETSNLAYSRAAKVLLQHYAGRPAMDDRSALAEIADLLTRNQRLTFASTARRVARARHPADDPRRHVERFRRKWQKKHARKSIRASGSLRSSDEQMQAARG